MLLHCANLKAIRDESVSLNRIVADKLDRVMVPLKSQLVLLVFGLCPLMNHSPRATTLIFSELTINVI